jgi:hypothetical protein
MRRDAKLELTATVIHATKQSAAAQRGVEDDSTSYSTPLTVPSGLLHSHDQTVDAARFAVLIEDATKKILTGGKQWSDDMLSLTITGPQFLPLELIDLPGLIADADHREDVKMVKEMTLNWMRQPNSIMLCALSAATDMQNHKITRVLKNIDNAKQSTHFVVMSLDSDMGQHKEDEYRSKVVNQAREGEESWHLLRNRGPGEKGARYTLDWRNQVEAAFFSEPRWRDISEEHKGIEPLRERLRQIVRRHALDVLPSIKTELRCEAEKLDRQLNSMSPNQFVGPDANKRRDEAYDDALDQLRTFITHHGDGNYHHDTMELDSTSPVLLRDRIRGRNQLFRDILYKSGHAWSSPSTPVDNGADKDIVSSPAIHFGSTDAYSLGIQREFESRLLRNI